MSSAAIWSFLLALFCCPCVGHVFAMALVREVFPSSAGRYERTIEIVLMLLTTASAVVLSSHTVNRIGRSGGTLRGRGLAIAALVIGLVWWTLLALLAMIHLFG